MSASIAIQDLPQQNPKVKAIMSNLNHEIVATIPLKRLNCSFDIVNVDDHAQNLRDIVRQEARKNRADVIIVYAVRKVGCPSCREHALQLSELAQKDRRVHLMGVVKETGIADDVLLEFYQDYFGRHDLYKDEKWRVYKAMGNHKLSLRQAMLGFFRSRRRFREKNIKMPTSKSVGESLIQGGIVMFDREGDLHFAYNEEFKEFDMDMIAQVMVDIRRRRRAAKKTSSSIIPSITETSPDLSDSSLSAEEI